MPTTREGLERSVPFLLARSEDDGSDGDGLSLSGYAAVFDQETEIDSWEGNFTEELARGAFRKTIRERTPVMQFDHGRHPLIGSIPIGSIETLREDDKGLFVEGTMSDNWLIEPVVDAIRNKRVNGMSFRFEVIRDEWRDVNGKLVKDDELMQLLWRPEDRGPLKRTIKEVRMHELGPVVFPAYVGTSVDVRSRDLASLVVEDGELVREVRSALARDECNISMRKSLLEMHADRELRKKVAREILFGDMPVNINHSSTREVPREVEVIEPLPPVGGTQDEVVEDAPLIDEHSSKPEISRLDPARIRRDAEYRREYVQLVMRGNRYAGDPQSS